MAQLLTLPDAVRNLPHNDDTVALKGTQYSPHPEGNPGTWPSC